MIMANSRGMQVKPSNKNSFFYNSNINDNIEFTLNDDITTKISVKNTTYVNNNSLVNLNSYKQFLYNILVAKNDNGILFKSNIGIDVSNNTISPIKDETEKKLPEWEKYIEKYGRNLWISALDIITCLFYDEITSVFIDEVEIGLHYTNFPKFCEVLIEISTNKNIQFFITTHSDEFLKDFYNISAKKGNKDITIYRFQKIDGYIKTVYYPYERAINALKDG